METMPPFTTGSLWGVNWCCAPSTKHGKTDKTQKITLKRKIHGKWGFDKTEFQK